MRLQQCAADQREPCLTVSTGDSPKRRRGHRASPRIGEAAAACDLTDRGARHHVAQLGTHLFRPDWMECREWGGVAELAEYRTGCPDTTTRRNRDLLHRGGQARRRGAAARDPRFSYGPL